MPWGSDADAMANDAAANDAVGWDAAGRDAGVSLATFARRSRGSPGWEPGLPGAATKQLTHHRHRAPRIPPAPVRGSAGDPFQPRGWGGPPVVPGLQRVRQGSAWLPRDPRFRHRLRCRRGPSEGARGLLAPPSPSALPHRRHSPPGRGGGPRLPPHGPRTLSPGTGRAHEEEPERPGRARGAGEAAPGGAPGAPGRGWGPHGSVYGGAGGSPP